MSAVGELQQREERRPFIRFERVPVDDKAASDEAGHYVAKDVDYVLVTPAYSKDVFKQEVSSWFEQCQRDVNAGRLPDKWLYDFKEMYQRWQNGQEMPPNGTPIKGWGVISPAMQQTLIHMNILTIEDLSQVNDEGMKRIGMGALDLKNKAQAWLDQMNDKGKLTMEMAALKQENLLLKGSLENLEQQFKLLQNQLKVAQSQTQQPAQIIEAPETEEITANDILPEEEEEPL